jgi:hypothetical protein
VKIQDKKLFELSMELAVRQNRTWWDYYAPLLSNPEAQIIDARLRISQEMLGTLPYSYESLPALNELPLEEKMQAIAYVDWTLRKKIDRLSRRLFRVAWVRLWRADNGSVRGQFYFEASQGKREYREITSKIELAPLLDWCCRCGDDPTQIIDAFQSGQRKVPFWVLQWESELAAEGMAAVPRSFEELLPKLKKETNLTLRKRLNFVSTL